MVKFRDEDFVDLTACCQQVNLTPRSVKRLVNVLKLVKIFWFRNLGQDRPRPVKRSVMGLLALAAAYPEIMREAFAQLDTKYRDQREVKTLTVSEFLSSFNLADKLHSAYAWQLERFRNDVQAMKCMEIDDGSQTLEFCDITLEELSSEAFNLVRAFSFVGDPSYAIDQKEIQPSEARDTTPRVRRWGVGRGPARQKRMGIE